MCSATTIRDLIPGYALGCLDSTDADAVRAHLASCEDCRRELASFARVVDGLAAAVPAVDPPPALEKRLREALGRPAAVTRGRFAAAIARRPWLSVAAVLLVFFLGAGNVLQWTGILPARGPRGNGPLLTIPLEGVGAGHGAFGTVVLDRNDRDGVMAVTGMPALQPGQQYQLWLVRGSERRSAGVFSVDGEGYGTLVMTVPADFRDFRALGVSVEPAGGSAAPTGPRVMGGAL